MNKITKVAVGSNEWDVWVLDSNGRLWSVSGSSWVVDQDARAVSVAVDGHGIIWIVNHEGQIWYKGKNETAWHEKSLPNKVMAKEIASGHDVTMVIDSSSHTWRYVYGGSAWVQVSGSATHVASGFGSTNQYCVNAGGTFYKYNGQGWAEYNQIHTDKNAKLSKVIGLAMGRGASDTRLFCLAGGGSKGGHIYQHAASGKYYFDEFGVATAFAVRNADDIWTVNSSGDIYRRMHTSLKKPAASASHPAYVGTKTSQTVNNVKYDWQRITEPALNQATFHWKKMQDTKKKTTYWQKILGAG